MHNLVSVVFGIIRKVWFKRNQKIEKDSPLMIFEGTEHEMADEDWIAAPVKKGIGLLNECTSNILIYSISV